MSRFAKASPLRKIRNLVGGILCIVAFVLVFLLMKSIPDDISEAKTRFIDNGYEVIEVEGNDSFVGFSASLDDNEGIIYYFYNASDAQTYFDNYHDDDDMLISNISMYNEQWIVIGDKEFRNVFRGK